jgi:hypothetical protein
MERRLVLSQVPRKPLARCISQADDYLEIGPRCNTTYAQRFADPRIHAFASHIDDTSKPTPQNKPLPLPPSISKSLANPVAQILRPSSTQCSNQTYVSECTQELTRAPLPKFSNRDLLPSQRLRRNGNILPSVWTHRFTKDGLERADSGVDMGPRQVAVSEHDAFFKPQQPQRSFSSDFWLEDISLGPAMMASPKDDGKDHAEASKIGKEESEAKPPSQTFDDILRGMGKSRRVPTALREL